MTRTDLRPGYEVERLGAPADSLRRSEELAAHIWKHRTTAAEPRGVRLVSTHRLAGAGTLRTRSAARSAMLGSRAFIPSLSETHRDSAASRTSAV